MNNFNFKMNLTLKTPRNIRSTRTQHHPHHIHNNNNSRVYFLHESHGIGDSVFNLIFFNLIEERIIANNILFCYFAKNEYIQQLTQFINPRLINNVKLFSLDKKPQQSIEMWINNPHFGYTFDCSLNSQCSVDYNNFYLNYFKHVLQRLTINANIQSILYSDNELLIRANAIPPEYKPVDVLILNSQPFSGQYNNYNKCIWDKYIQHLNSNSSLKIVTTTKVEGVLCTFDKNLTIKDIAALSTHAKVIIAINSGVFPGLLNVHTMETVKQFFIFDNRCHYSFPRFQNKCCITEISMNDLNYYVTM